MSLQNLKQMLDLKKLQQEVEYEYVITGVASLSTDKRDIADDFARAHKRTKAMLVSAGYEVDQLNKLNDDIDRCLKVEL
tara:strand:+ start:9468 stop:9704 length:237 start_codon:yes stop_codon:yes gene_type:complete